MRRSISVAKCVRSAMEARPMMSARAVDHRKPPSQIAHFVHESSVRVGDVECLHELQARSRVGVSFTRYAFKLPRSVTMIREARCHDESLTKKFGRASKQRALHLYRLIRFSATRLRCLNFSRLRNRLLAASAFFLCAERRKLDATFLPGFLACLSLRPAYELEQASQRDRQDRRRRRRQIFWLSEETVRVHCVENAVATRDAPGRGAQRGSVRNAH